MKFKTLLTGFSLAAVGLILTACSSSLTHGKMASVEAAGGAQTYGLKGSKGYVDSNGFHINAMRSPTNQTYYFGFNGAQLRPQDIKAIDIQANYLITHPKAKIRLEGNTDNRGSREYNVGLGWRRDQSVARLLQQQGVSPKQIQMVSYGKERPAVFGNSAHAWDLNRRVSLLYKAY